MYRRDIPCSHRLYLGATTKKQFSELILDIINDVNPQKKWKTSQSKQLQ